MSRLSRDGLREGKEAGEGVGYLGLACEGGYPSRAHLLCPRGMFKSDFLYCDSCPCPSQSSGRWGITQPGVSGPCRVGGRGRVCASGSRNHSESGWHQGQKPGRGQSALLRGWVVTPMGAELQPWTCRMWTTSSRDVLILSPPAGRCRNFQHSDHCQV